MNRQRAAPKEKDLNFTIKKICKKHKESYRNEHYAYATRNLKGCMQAASSSTIHMWHMPKGHVQVTRK